ncbi:lysozyme [Salmonella enterica]|uniref:lysozyme n=1 Tax=Citrobacter freundii TaxID=546 RepID=UPI001413ECA5|nr:lysozyme [Citrobacter freundii]EAZ5991683.1 lysozyme [Salmonella enterica]EBY2261603.1 lysozyme [Salmonella enterica subsp. enterica serovar Newport]EBJ0730110.1 lysozyme [Salmonella enterica]ECO6783089.1 lysozyme [Salmonella enterica]ECO7517325.1 lysozyme [Salmonella enterica]
MSSIVKRCSVAAVVALAALMPDFRLLHTSRDGLALLADLEGCRLRPYQCSAGVWTSGIGHTAGVMPKHDITEKDAAKNLIADVLNTERRLAACAPVDMPPQVYDAVVSFAFNVGTGAACKSTLAYFLNQKKWKQACDQLPRWVYIDGVKNTGLENRRKRERDYCIKGVK